MYMAIETWLWWFCDQTKAMKFCFFRVMIQILICLQVILLPISCEVAMTMAVS